MNESNDRYYRMFAQVFCRIASFVLVNQALFHTISSGYVEYKKQLFLYCGEPGGNIKVSGFLIGRPKR